jgi:hypothetical protein
LVPFGDARISRLLAGMARARPPAHPARPLRSAITPSLLSQIVSRIRPTTLGRALRAGLALGFFGLLRAGEFTAKPNSAVLLRQHVTWAESHVQIFLASSKTDRAGRGVTVRIFRNGSPICAVALLKEAWDAAPIRSPTAPLLQTDSLGAPLAYHELLGCIKSGVQELGLDPACYGAHSLRIGGATQLAASNFSDSQIQAVGRWTSDCFRRYIRFGDHFYQSVSSSLATSGLPHSAVSALRSSDWSQSRAPPLRGAAHSIQATRFSS